MYAHITRRYHVFRVMHSKSVPFHSYIEIDVFDVLYTHIFEFYSGSPLYLPSMCVKFRLFCPLCQKHSRRKWERVNKSKETIGFFLAFLPLLLLPQTFDFHSDFSAPKSQIFPLLTQFFGQLFSACPKMWTKQKILVELCKENVEISACASQMPIFC